PLRSSTLGAPAQESPSIQIVRPPRYTPLTWTSSQVLESGAAEVSNDIHAKPVSVVVVVMESIMRGEVSSERTIVTSAPTTGSPALRTSTLVSTAQPNAGWLVSTVIHA